MENNGGISIVGELKSSSVISRYSANPILTADDMPCDATLVYNCGVVKYQDRYVMAIRNDYYKVREPGKWDTITIHVAFSNDGINWDVQPDPIFESNDDEFVCFSDPRLTVIEGRQSRQGNLRGNCHQHEKGQRARIPVLCPL